MNHKKLLILCCHGVYHKGEFYTERPKERKVYKAHIWTAFNALKDGRYDTLIISGGCSKLQVEKSEARGYLDWADELGLARTGLVILEEFSRSSAENLLFSMCRFYQYFGYFPEKVGSCTLFWKEKCHKEVIAPALRLPNTFEVITVEKEREKLEEIGGLVLGPEQVANDNKGDPLEIQKDVKQRDRWEKGHPYANINQEFKDLFDKFDKLVEIRKEAEEMKNRGESPEKIEEFLNRGGASLKYPWAQ